MRSWIFFPWKFFLVPLNLIILTPLLSLIEMLLQYPPSPRHCSLHLYNRHSMSIPDADLMKLFQGSIFCRFFSAAPTFFPGLILPLLLSSLLILYKGIPFLLRMLSTVLSLSEHCLALNGLCIPSCRIFPCCKSNCLEA